MKVVILTQPLKHNYGGLLQAFATQQVIKNIGHDVVTANRRRDKKDSSLITKSKNLIKRIVFRRLTISDDVEKIAYKNTLNFIDAHINLSGELKSTESLSNYFRKNQFDAVIVGSDQTWRPKYSPNIFNYFLDFLADNTDIKKIAFASSFGTDEWEYTPEQQDKCRALIKKFDAVSVRESGGVNLCKQYLDYDPSWVVDPTLLLNANDYENAFKSNTCVFGQRQGIFTYVLDSAQDKKEIIQIVGVILGKPIYTNQASRVIHKAKKNKLQECVLPPVENWVSSFSNAEFVVTDSFHGCVFSIIFNKPFIAIANNVRGLARFQSLLTMFGLSDRLIIDAQKVDKRTIDRLINTPIDWKNVNEIKAREMQKAFSFLTSNISK